MNKDEAEIHRVIREFAAAVDRDDFAGIVGLLCGEEAEDLLENVNPDDAPVPEAEPVLRPIEASDLRIVGHVASALITRPDQQPTTMYLRREPDGWKFCAPAEDEMPAL